MVCAACVQACVPQARVPQQAVELLYAGALLADAEWRVPAWAKALVLQQGEGLVPMLQP